MWFYTGATGQRGAIKFGNVHVIWICRGFGGWGAEPYEANEDIKKLVEKSMETCKLLKILMNYDSIFSLKANFNNKGEVVVLLEIINNSKRN